MNPGQMEECLTFTHSFTHCITLSPNFKNLLVFQPVFDVGVVSHQLVGENEPLLA